jgi:DNA-binding NtrC family response regulator
MKITFQAPHCQKKRKTKFRSYYWTHNVTELRSVMEKASENANEGVIDINAIEVR